MVSVIIPTYNRSNFLKEAVDSVLAQKGVAVEVIVVDDGSTDETASILESFGPAIRSVYQPRSGVSAARNRGIRMATSEWLAFLDSDDLWLDRKLVRQLDFLARHHDLRICQTEEIWIRNQKRINPRKYHEKPRGHCFPLLLERCLVSPSAVIIHREIFEEVGLFDETLPACEDFDLWLRIGCRHPIGLLGEPLIIKRGGHADQLSASIPCLDLYRIQALAKLLCKEPLRRDHREAALEAMKRKGRVYIAGCRKRGKHDEADAVEALMEQAASESST
jgi:glycosyltransferase involved in cell wall biosynthesis